MKTLVVLAVTAALLVAAVDDCTAQKACVPWPTNRQNPCARGERMDLRIMLDVAATRYVTDAYNGTDTDTRAVYPFCPVVDQLQAFQLNRSVAITSTDVGGWFSATPNTTRLAVYGMGFSGDVRMPGALQDSSVVAYANISECADPGDGIPKPAVVSFLVLNITLTKGVYYYHEGFDQPVQAGFLPTCDSEDVCVLGGNQHCIGEPGRRNCARCVNPGLVNQTIKIWTAYYGTDVNGRQLTSGADNPLNFIELSNGGVGTTLNDDLNKL